MARARLLQQVREFFAKRGVLEVETPLLARHCPSDPCIDSIPVPYAGAQAWLQSSPEYAMKRLLASGSGDIYQICKAFRAGEAGSRHNPEFTMLEWYRQGFDLMRLADETVNLLRPVLPVNKVEHYSYRELFLQAIALDPHRATLVELQAAIDKLIEADFVPEDGNTCLDLLFSHCVQPQLSELSFVFDYPASQAMLAVVANDSAGQAVAKRFECFYKGMELANAYEELLDAEVYLGRQQLDSERRSALGKDIVAADMLLYSAMKEYVRLEETPAYCGIALGIDRVLMLQLGYSHIRDVLSFDSSNA